MGRGRRKPGPKRVSPPDKVMNAHAHHSPAVHIMHCGQESERTRRQSSKSELSGYMISSGISLHTLDRDVHFMIKEKGDG